MSESRMTQELIFSSRKSLKRLLLKLYAERICSSRVLK